MADNSTGPIRDTNIAKMVAIFVALTLSSYGLTSVVFAQGPPTIPVSPKGSEEVHFGSNRGNWRCANHTNRNGI